MGGEGASEGRKSPSEPLNLRVRKGGGTKGEEKLESTERGESYETGRRAGVFLTGCWRSVNISLKKIIEVIFPT